MQILDFDEFIPEDKIVKLKGKEFNITEIPFEIALQFNQAYPVLTALSENKEISKEEFDKLFQLIYSIFKISVPDLEEEWLRKNLTTQRFNKIITLISQAMFDEGKKKETEQ